MNKKTLHKIGIGVVVVIVGLLCLHIMGNYVIPMMQHLH
jgi:hypothetical protein